MGEVEEQTEEQYEKATSGEGDLTLIDALHGIKARTIREGCSSSKDADDDEYASIDKTLMQL